MSDMTQWQAELEMHRLYLEARTQRNSFYEKLALLDGGTVALAVTAIIGPLHGKVKYPIFLGVGLSVLVTAMLVLLIRNLLAAQYEFHAAADAARDPRYFQNTVAVQQTATLNKNIHTIETAGVIISGTGIALLLIEVWLILICS